MLTQRTCESLAAIQAMLRDPEHELAVKEWDRLMGEVTPYRQRTGKAPHCLDTLHGEDIGDTKPVRLERVTA